MKLPYKIDLSGKVAVITGAGGILMSEFARALAECGAKVALLDINEKAANFNLTLDVRGMRGEEALDAVSKYIDDASLLSIKNISILPGKGNGILRQLIRQQLSKMSCVQQMQDASLETGGHGITRVTLR